MIAYTIIFFLSFTGDADGKVIGQAEAISMSEEEYEIWYMWEEKAYRSQIAEGHHTRPNRLWQKLGLNKDAINLIGRDDKIEKLVREVVPEDDGPIPQDTGWFVNEKGIHTAIAMSDITAKKP